MKIIKRGELPQDKIHRMTCSKCKSELEFFQSEVIPSPDQRDHGEWFISCPVCQTYLFGKYK